MRYICSLQFVQRLSSVTRSYEAECFRSRLAQLVRAPPLQGGGRQFESDSDYQSSRIHKTIFLK